MDLKVELPWGKKWVCARIDTGCNVNVISEHAASRLVDVTNLPDSELGVISGISRAPVTAYKVMKLNFSLCFDDKNNGGKNHRDVFHVLKNEDTHQAFDVLLGKRLLRVLDLVTEGKKLLEVMQSRQALMTIGASSHGLANASAAQI